MTPCPSELKVLVPLRPVQPGTMLLRFHQQKSGFQQTTKKHIKLVTYSSKMVT
jgi:hypothetical protein